MTTCSIFILLIIFMYYMNISLADDPIIGTQVHVRSKVREQNTTDVYPLHPPTNPYYVMRPSSLPPPPPPPSKPTNAFPLMDSDCFCSYDSTINLLLCSPLFQDSLSSPFPDTNISPINITLNDCTFPKGRLNLPLMLRKNVDQLRLYNINYQNYLVLDATSFSSYTINQLYIVYSYSQPITMLLISNETFSSPTISLVLRTLYITSCHLVTLNKPFNRLFLLESITLNNIDQFSWHDFQQQIVRLPKLRSISITEDILSLTSDIFNAISCPEISSQWSFTYRSVQTCSCTYMAFLRTVRRFGNIYKCPNADSTIDFIDDICQYHGREYEVQNHTNLFCNKCSTYRCSQDTACAEAYDSEPSCISLSRSDYKTIQNRIPLTPYTRQFLLQESQGYLSSNPNKTLEPSGFNSVAMILINSSQNQTSSSSDAQMFHQTFSEMLDRPWSPAIYNTSNGSPAVWQQLLVCIDGSVQNINGNDSKFVFQSKPISTMSLRFPPDQKPPETFGWKITNDNQITGNITNSEAIDKSVTSRVFLKLNPDQLQKPDCNTSNNTNNCTDRFSIISFKSPKLFYITDRIPEYDVISILAPSRNQTVTFYFEQKVSIINSSEPSINSSSDPLYDQLDMMISEGTCMYLNTTSMIWQTDGCVTDRHLSNSTSVTCTCEHLTMFTVFFSLSCTIPSKELQILSWIGCILSIIGLSLTLILFIAIRQCRKTRSSANGISSSHSSSSQELRKRIMSKPRRLSMVKSMLLILCILLILMNILILILTFIKSARDLACTILAAALYYFTLTAFIWKLFISVQQSLFITNIFHSYWSDRTLFIIYLILTFSIPIIPLLVMFITFQDSTFISSTCNYCWLTREFLLYGLMIPVLVIVCLNIMFYLYTMIHLCMRNRQQPGLRSTKSDQSRRMQNFKVGLFFAIIMGLSWVLGFLLLIPNSYVQTIGNILFCIFNTLQGFAFSIMVFCMLERKSFRKCCCFWKYPNTMQTKLDSSKTAPQQSVPTPNNDNDAKIKALYNSSTYTSSSASDADNNLPDVFEEYQKKKSSMKKDDDADEHVYTSPTF